MYGRSRLAELSFYFERLIMSGNLLDSLKQLLNNLPENVPTSSESGVEPGGDPHDLLKKAFAEVRLPEQGQAPTAKPEDHQKHS